MPIPIASKISRQLGTDIIETGQILEELVQDVRRQVAREGKATVPGLGIFRSFAGRIVFEPERALSLGVNHRYAGLEPLLVSAAELAPPAQSAATLKSQEQPVSSVEDYPSEAPSLAVHVEDVPPALDDNQPEAQPSTEETSDHGGDAFDAQDVYPAAELEDRERVETAALQEITVEDVPVPDEPEFTEELAGSSVPLPEVTVHEPDEESLQSLEQEQFPDSLTSSPSSASSLPDYEELSDEEEDFENFLAQEEPALPTAPTSTPSPFFDPWPGEIQEPRQDLEPVAEETDEETTYSLLQAVPDLVEEQTHTDAASENEPVTEQGLTEEHAQLAAYLQDGEPEPVTESSFRPEPIDDDYSIYASQSAVPIQAEPEAGAPVQEERVRPVPPAPEPARRRSSTPLIIATVVLLALIGLLAYSLTRPDEPPTSPAIVDADPPGAAPSDTSGAQALPADSANAAATDPVETEQPPPSPLRPTGGIDVSQGGLTLIVASETTRNNAEQVAERFENAGYTPVILYGEYGGIARYRVGIGQFLDEAEAESQRNNLPEAFPDDAWLMPIRSDMQVIP
jgi:hypothetical protein